MSLRVIIPPLKGSATVTVGNHPTSGRTDSEALKV